MTQQGRVAFGRMEAVSFGRPAAEAVAQEVAALGAERVFLMVSGTLNRETDEIAKLRRALGNKCVGTFDRMKPHTPRADVIAAARAVRDVGADVIVTLGGGSITDAAKAVRLCLANGVDTPAAMDMFRPVKGPDGTLGPPPCAAPTVRQIAVPTTLSAGDFSGLAGVTDERVQAKEIFRHPGMMPSAVVLDPAVTVHTPEWLWLSTGIRALDHCVEGVCAKEAHAYGDAQALQGLSLLARGLPGVKRDPGDLDARLDCQMGMWLSMGPLASGVPMGASHGIGYVLGAMFDVPHGHTSCIMLPAVMRWNKRVNADRQALVATAMGHPGEDAGDVLDAFIGGLGMPRSLSAVGIGPDRFQRIAEGALSTPWVPRNPRPIPSPAEVLEILQLAA
ncbi:maleylacetate reductase [Thalassobaculum fulvum]|uniref:Maleylacetate reductase n=1 Tax=Thalassobaculum fulvum TaxID=1633335 RepID=A0A919CPV9_9PROT|nr:iron-containing alcohol dehydrogenase [Thalassobaculum fulvum]GHD52390.1 maleylacetate reductase [Thalassobaculum fulvum]